MWSKADTSTPKICLKRTLMAKQRIFSRTSTKSHGRKIEEVVTWTFTETRIMARRPRWTSRQIRSKDRFSSFIVINRLLHLISRQAHLIFPLRITISTPTQSVTPTSTLTCNQIRPHSSSISTICHIWSQRPTAIVNRVRMVPRSHKLTRLSTTTCLCNSLRPPLHSPTRPQTLTRTKIITP